MALCAVNAKASVTQTPEAAHRVLTDLTARRAVALVDIWGKKRKRETYDKLTTEMGKMQSYLKLH